MQRTENQGSKESNLINLSFKFKLLFEWNLCTWCDVKTFCHWQKNQFNWLSLFLVNCRCLKQTRQAHTVWHLIWSKKKNTQATKTIGASERKKTNIWKAFKVQWNSEWKRKQSHDCSDCIQKSNEPCGKYGKCRVKCVNLCVEIHSNCTAHKLLWAKKSAECKIILPFARRFRAILSYFCSIYFRLEKYAVAACSRIVGVVRFSPNQTVLYLFVENNARFDGAVEAREMPE